MTLQHILRDFPLFSGTLLKIKDKEQRVIPLRFNPTQAVLWAHIKEQIDKGVPPRIVCLKSRQQGICLDPSTLVLTSDLRWVALGSISPGDRLVGVFENAPLEPSETIRERVRELTPVMVEAIEEREARAFEIVTDMGSVIATAEHRFLTCQDRSRSVLWVWLPVREFVEGKTVICFLVRPSDSKDELSQVAASLAAVGPSGRRVACAGARVLRVVPLGRRRVIDLQTSGGTFIANGFVSHNSTFSQAFTFWRAMRPNTNALCIAHDIESTTRIFEIAKFFYENLPVPVRPMKRYSNRREIVLENPDEKTRPSNPGLRSKIEIRTAGNISAGMGLTLHVLHVSEVAMYTQPELVWAALTPAVPYTRDSCIIVESTAHLMGQWFRDFWFKSKAGQTGYVPVFLPWFLSPEYTLEGAAKDLFLSTGPITEEERDFIRRFGLTEGQIAWRRSKIDEARGSVDLFRQSFPFTDEEAFIAVGSPLIPFEVIERLASQTTAGTPGEMVKRTFTASPFGRLKIWKPPEPGKSYTVGVDTSQGSEGSDPACIQVISSGPIQEQVACWHGRIGAIEMAEIVESLAVWYNHALVAPEVNNTGISLLTTLRERGVCVAPEARVLTTDLRWVPAGDLKVGDAVVGFDEEGVGGRGRRYFRRAVVEGCDIVRLPRRRVVFEGGEIVVSREHPFLVRRDKDHSDGKGLGWVTADELVEGDEIAYLAAPGEEVGRLFGRGRRAFAHGQNRAYVKVLRKEPLTEGEVVALATSTRTFIAEGCLSHNCRLYRWRFLDKVGAGLTTRYGWWTTPSSKPTLISSLRHQLLSGKLVVNDPDTVAELRTFVIDARGSAAAAPGYHDDRLMALAIASICDMLDGGEGGWAARPPEQEPTLAQQDPIRYDLLPDLEEAGRDWRISV